MLKATLAELHIKHASFLVNFDDWRARIVSYDSALCISIHCILLDQRHITRIFLGQFNFMADSDVGVNHSIFSTHMHESVWVVSL